MIEKRKVQKCHSNRWQFAAKGPRAIQYYMHSYQGKSLNIFSNLLIFALPCEFGQDFLKTCLKLCKFQIKIEKWSLFRLYVTLKDDGSHVDKKASFKFFKVCLQGFFWPI